MGANLGTLTLDLIAKIGGFTAPLDKAERQAKKSMKGIQQSAEDASMAVKGLSVAAGALGGALSVAGVAAFLTATSSAAMQLKGLERQFKVSTGSSLLAADSLSFIREKANELGMDVKELTTSYARFMNAIKGTANEGQRGRDAFVGISEGIVAVGLSVEEQSRVWAQLAQGIMKGKFEMDDLKTIQEAGLPIIKLMADALGKTTDELLDMQQKGKLLVDDVLPKLGEAMHKEFGKTAKEAADDAQGGVARFKNEVRAAAEDIGNLLLPAVNESANALAKMIKFMRSAHGSTKAIRDEFALPEDIAFAERNKNGIDSDPQMSRALADKKADQDAAARKAKIAADIARKNKEAADLAEKERKAAAAAEKSRLKSIADELKAFELKAASIGLDQESSEVEKLRAKGATEAQLEQARAAQQQIDDYQEQLAIAKEMEELQKAGAEFALEKAETQTEEAKKLAAFTASQAQMLASSHAGLNIGLIGTGSSDKAKQRAQELLNIQQKYNEDVAALTEQYTGGDISKDLYDQETQVLRDTLAQRLDLQKSYYAELDKAQGDFNAGASTALANYLESSSDYASIANSLVTDQIGNMESGLSNAISSMVMESQTLGEAFSTLAKGMATSMINALSDIAAKWLVTQALQLMFGKATQAGAAATMTANAQATSLQAGLAAFASTAAIPIVGPLAAPGAMAAALAITEPMAAAVSAAALSGMAHDGIDAVPNDGTWLLQKGERVTTAETSAKLDRTLDNVQKSQGGGAPIVNLIEDKSKAGKVENRQQDGKSIIDIFVADLMGDGRVQKAMSRKFGMQPVGA